MVDEEGDGEHEDEDGEQAAQRVAPISDLAIGNCRRGRTRLYSPASLVHSHDEARWAMRILSTKSISVVDGYYAEVNSLPSRMESHPLIPV